MRCHARYVICVIHAHTCTGLNPEVSRLDAAHEAPSAGADLHLHCSASVDEVAVLYQDVLVILSANGNSNCDGDSEGNSKCNTGTNMVWYAPTSKTSSGQTRPSQTRHTMVSNVLRSQTQNTTQRDI